MFIMAMLLVALFLSLCLAVGTGLLAAARFRTIDEITFMLKKTDPGSSNYYHAHKQLSNLGSEALVCSLFCTIGVASVMAVAAEIIRGLIECTF